MSEPSLTAVKTLFAQCRNLCFFERCEEKLTDPAWKKVNGIIAHIKGEHPGSARYDPDQPDSERQGYENLMLLCPKHSREVDDLLPDQYPVERLQEMRAKHLSHVGDKQWCTDDEATRFAVHAIEAIGVAPSPETDAEAQREAAEREGLAAERDRLRQRLEHIGEIVEEVFWTVDEDEKCTPPTNKWMAPRNRLRQALVGLTNQLPRCEEVVNEGMPHLAKGAAAEARNEIEAMLLRLQSEHDT